MKNLTFSLLALCLGLLIFEGCTKNGLSALNRQLIASKTTIAINQPDSVLMVGISGADSAQWTVTPAGFNSIIGAKKNLAIITFTKPGTYTVQGSVNGANAVTTTITVTDAVPVTASGTISLAGDQITLLSNYYKNKAGDTTYIYFTAQTTKTYACSNSVINYTQNLDANNSFSLNFINVLQPAAATCRIGNGTLASGIIPFMQNKQNPYMTPGTYPLAVTLNGTTYSGSITISATNIVFNWTYKSGVIITPLHFDR